MSLEEALLSSSIKVGLDLIARAGFGDEVTDLHNRLAQTNQRKREAAFKRAFEAAAAAYRKRAASTDDQFSRLLAHLPFRAELLAGLLNPASGCDLAAVSAEWVGHLPNHALAIQTFFVLLENALTDDSIWGPILQRYRELRADPKVTAALQALSLPTTDRALAHTLVELNGSGGLAVGQSNQVGGAGSRLAGHNYYEKLVRVTIEKLVVVSSAAPLTPADPGEKELRVYLAKLAAECAALPLSNIHEKLSENKSLSVSIERLFIDIEVVETELNARMGIPHLQHQLERGEGKNRKQLLEAIAQNNASRIVLLGAPGCGKTTFINFLTWQLAQSFIQDRSPELPGIFSGKIPVRFVLRKVAAHISADSDCGSAALLWDALEEDLKSRKCGDAFKLLRENIISGNAIILLDGLDEVLEANRRRASLLESIQLFINEIGLGSRVILTARPYAYANPAWQMPESLVLLIAPFSKEQTNRFIERWYRVVGPILDLDTTAAQKCAERLSRAIMDRSELADLGSRPLLLALIAAINASDASWIIDRAELYERAVMLLVKHWESKKIRVGFKDSDFKMLDASDVLDVLAELAFKVHQRQRSDTIIDGAANITLEELLLTFNRIRSVHPMELTEYLEQRAGLIVQREPEVYCFVHRSFQEYLAACFLLDTSSDRSADLRQLWEEDDIWWHQVVLMALGKSRMGGLAGAVDLVVSTLLPVGIDEVAHPSSVDWLCAIQATQEFIDMKLMDPRNRGEVPHKLPRARQWLVRLLQKNALPARDRVRAGHLLAQISDPRFDPKKDYLPVDDLLGFRLVSTGLFLMGSNPLDDRQAVVFEQPQHSFTLDDFYMQMYPVTVAQFTAFVNQSGFVPENADCLQGISNHPVVWVNWNDAMAYCRWLEGRLEMYGPDPIIKLIKNGWYVTLPSEAQWEKAARGPDGRIYPWGSIFISDKVNSLETGLDRTSAVGCFSEGQSPYGIYDLSGNVWEWTRSLWGENFRKMEFGYPYLDRINDRENQQWVDIHQLVIRGGSCSHDFRDVRCACRNRRISRYNYNYLGFRVVLSTSSDAGF